MSTLVINDLQVSVDIEGGTKEILKGVDLTIEQGSIHAIMGPNGSGKSTLAYTIAGHPKYHVTGGSIRLDGEDVLAMTVDARARAGLFLAMQYPVEIPGVTVTNFLRTAKTAIDGEAPAIRGWSKQVKGVDGGAAHGSGVRRAQRQRGLLGRREEAPRDPAARTAQTQVRHPRRDRLRPRRRRPEDRLGGRQPGPRGDRPRRAPDHALHADPALHPPRLRPRLRRWPGRRRGRTRARRPPRERGLRPLHRPRRGCGRSGKSTPRA